MCRLYGLRANEPTKVECTLVHAQNALMVQSREDLKGYAHAHGWGVATYENHHPQVDRQAWAAYHGEHFRNAAAKVFSRTVIAHVRRATVGAATLENTHPFTWKQWTFAHNGTIPNFEAMKPRLMNAMSEQHRASIKGQTDSECLFRYIISQLDSRNIEDIRGIMACAIQQIALWAQELSPNKQPGLNVLLTDGDRLAGTRWGRSLVFVERDGVYDCEICGFPHIRHQKSIGHKAVVVASEPISHEDWKSMPDKTAFSVSGGFRLELEPLSLPTS
jgi:predicted glutamine amidotransferase